jgi:hypothetical protein
MYLVKICQLFIEINLRLLWEPIARSGDPVFAVFSTNMEDEEQIQLPAVPATPANNSVKLPAF